MDFQVAIYGMGRFGRALSEALPEALLVRTGGRETPCRDFVGGLQPGTLVILSVPDDALDEVSGNFASVEGAARLAFVHPSGVRGVEALKPLGDAGARTGVFHVLQSFPPSGVGGHIAGSYAALSGGPEIVSDLKVLAGVLGCIPFELHDNQRVAYHAAAVLASNAVIGLLDTGRELLEQAGIPPEAASKMLIPLARGTLSNAGNVGVRGALTGPVARGDAGTIKRHLDVLTGDTRRTYVATMLAVCDTAERSGRTPPEKLAAIRALLAPG